jgi:hypothetical protein
MNDISEVAKLELRAAQIKLIKERPYWTRQDVMLVFNISGTRMYQLEKAGEGPPWMQIGGTPTIVASTAHDWFRALPNTEWAKARGAP